MTEDSLAVIALEMLVEANARACSPGQDRRERGLAHFQRLAAQVVAVQLDQVEGVEEDARVMAPLAYAIEARHAVVAAGDRLTIDDAGARWQHCHGLAYEGEAGGPVVPVPGEQADTRGVPPGEEAVAIVLDLVQPARPARGLLGAGWEAGFDEEAGTEKHASVIGYRRPGSESPARQEAAGAFVTLLASR